ncbi:hypothetical protein CDAR_163751 [Caerostris darwini]|uniref:Uncharacterized protein n=1 Tax=Caerostris darwini TaxID=1538125 RepID=A0AAV4RUE8_9ARAC|nr:hypothetical protein CDAR_163751 [Caerostris darwini]
MRPNFHRFASTKQAGSVPEGSFHWVQLSYQPYSPTEAPTDYDVNQSLKNWQTNKVYDDFDNLVADVKAWIASKNRDFFARGIDRLPSKWEAIIEVDCDNAPD